MEQSERITTVVSAAPAFQMDCKMSLIHETMSRCLLPTVLFLDELTESHRQLGCHPSLKKVYNLTKDILYSIM